MSRLAVPRAAEGAAAIGATALAFAGLAALVWTGALSALDQYAVDHWMPNFEPSGDSGSTTVAHQFYPHLGSPLQVFCNVWTFPASAFVSGAVVAVCCLVLVRRGHSAAALAWGLAWIAANAAEVVGKHVLHRPALHAVHHGVRVSFDSFGHAFPSGHALRAVFTAVVVVTVWRRAALPALAWVVVALVALVVSAAHTPTDVLGGVLLALLVVLTVRRFLPRTRGGGMMRADAELLRRLDEGELGDPLTALAFLAGQEVELPEAELNEARRRAMLLLAAGGDPHRELGVDDRAVKSLAADLHTDGRRRELAAGIDELAVRARDLPRVREAALFLAGDVELAWRVYALALLADELAG